MYCLKCGAVTTNKLTKTCPRKGCAGKLRKNETPTFSVMRILRGRKY